MSKILISARDIKKEYNIGHTVLHVLKGIDLDLIEGEIIAIIGKSGAGKSTLLHILGMLDRPTSGDLIFNGETLGGKSDKDLAEFRNREIGFIFQFHHLISEFNAYENVLLPAMISGNKNNNSETRAKSLLERVGLSERLTHRPNELSGGELQRVAVARALINEPAIILADEPSGNLDLQNSEMLHDLIWELAREQGFTFVIVTHDISLAKRADRIMLIKDGVIEKIDIEKFNEQFFLENV